MNLLLVILGIFVVFFIPGYILTTLFLKNIKFKIPLSIGLSICVLILVGFSLGLFGLLKTGYLWGTMLILIIVPLIYFRNNFFNEIKSINFRIIFNAKNIIIFLLLMIVFFGVYFARFGPSSLYLEQTRLPSKSFFIPFHADEWTHLAQIKYSMASGENSFVNPYISYLPKHNNFEVGFHTFTTAFFLLTGLDAVMNYHWLAAVFAVISALLVYSFLFLFTKQRMAGIFGMLFFLSLPSNTNLMGSWFYVPMSMSLFLIFLFLTLLYQKRDTINFYLLGFVLIISLLTYPFVAILLGIIGLFYVFQNRNLIRSRIKSIHLVTIIALIFLTLSIIILLTDLKTILFLLVFEKGWRSIENIYSPISLVGIYWLFFSLVGVVVLFIKKYEKSILYALVILSLNIVAFYIFEKSLLLMYRINFYYFLVLMGIFGAVAAAYIFDQARIIFKHTQFLRLSLQGLILVILVFTLFSGYYRINNADHRLHRIINTEEFQALEELGQKYTGEVIMADILTSLAIYPMTGNYVAGLLSANLGGGGQEVYNFFKDDTFCEVKKQILESLDIKLVLSKKQIDCDFLKGEKKKGFYLYSVLN